MTNDDLKRFYPQNSTPEKSNDFVRYNANGEIPGVGGNGGEHETVIIDALPTATQGEITQEQLTTLQKNDANTLLFADEIYRLSDKRTSEGYLIYSHACQDNTDNFYIKCITITMSTLSWVLTSLNIGAKKYQHNINIKVGNNKEITFTLITSSNVPFETSNFQNLLDEIRNQGFNSSSKPLNCSGHSGFGSSNPQTNPQTAFIYGIYAPSNNTIYLNAMQIRTILNKSTVTIGDTEYDIITGTKVYKDTDSVFANVGVGGLNIIDNVIEV